jgi:curved DNA-binding protein CbpA
MPSATMEDKQQAYRKLAFQFHPDRNQMNLTYNQKMLEINEAYNTLCDIAKRRQYDIPKGYYAVMPKFKTGCKVRISARASPFNDHIGVVDQEPVKGRLRFWYMVKIMSFGIATIARFAEEQLNEVDQ